MDALLALSKKYGVMILEDACQGDGASYKGKRLGTIGDAGALSFNFFKVISAGEGGAMFTDNKTIFERALIYHDSSAVSFFGDQLDSVSAPVFCGNEYRTNDITSAILRVQLGRLDGIIADLRANKRRIMMELEGLCEFIPSNDLDGDLGSTLAIHFESADATERFISNCKTKSRSPINTGKHIYKNWTPIMNKCGALNPLMDPFKMEANKDIVPNYTENMCEKTLDLLAKTAYVSVNPDWTEEEICEVIANIKVALSLH